VAGPLKGGPVPLNGFNSNPALTRLVRDENALKRAVKVGDPLERVPRKVTVSRDHPPEGEQSFRKGFDEVGSNPPSHSNSVAQTLLNEDSLFGLTSQMNSDQHQL